MNFAPDKHTNYLLKLLKKPIAGSRFDATEVHRLSSLFFIVSGLDLLGSLDTRLTAQEKDDIIDWIYSYQVDVNKVMLNAKDLENDQRFPSILDRRVAHSGFRSTSIIDSDIPFDCGVISMTYCALTSLLILGDDLSRVDRASIVAGLKLLQLPDGSFESSALGGECDMRLVYCAVAISTMLNDWSGVDKDRCAQFIRSSLSYEGAFAQCPGAEAHGGSTYCGLASLKLMSELESTLSKAEIQRLTKWCLDRLDSGFSGRPNKDQDTCYSFWIGSCLVMLDHFQYIDQKRLLEFVLRAQEDRGGLSKVPTFYPDPLHTYLGIAGLTFVDEKLGSEQRVVLKQLEPTLNISLRAKNHMDDVHKSWSQ